MSEIFTKLAEVKNRPRTVEEWIERQGEDDRDLILAKLMTAGAAPVYKVISKLEDDPYPLGLSALQGYVRRRRG